MRKILRFFVNWDHARRRHG